MCERVRDPTAPNKILLRKILYKPNKYYVTSNQEKIKYCKILWFLSKEKGKEKEKKEKKRKKKKKERKINSFFFGKPNNNSFQFLP